MGRQQREKRKKSKSSKKTAKAKDEEIPSTPSGEVTSNELSPPTDPAQISSVGVENDVISVITPATEIQEDDRSPVRLSRRSTRIAKGEMPSEECMLSDDLVSKSGVEGEEKATSSVETPSAATVQEDDESPVRITRRMTRSCKVTARINETSSECDGKSSEASSKAEQALVESLQQHLEYAVRALQEESPTRQPMKGQADKVSPAMKSGTVAVESLDQSPRPLDLSKLSPSSNTASPVVCLERCSESDMLARQMVHSSYEALSFSPEEEDLLAAQKPMPLRRKLECVEELPSNEAARNRKNRKIRKHIGKRNGCRRKLSPSSASFSIQPLDEYSCAVSVLKSSSSVSAADVVTGENDSLCMGSEPSSPSQLGTRARSKRIVGRGEKRSFAGSDDDQVPCRKLLKLDSCNLGSEEGMESQSVMNCGSTNDTSDTRLHEQENSCKCNGNIEFSGSSRQCNCGVQSSFSYQSENLETQNKTLMHLEYPPGDSSAEYACDRSRSQSLDHCGSDIIPDDCSSVNISRSNANGQEDIYQDDPKGSSLKGSLVRGDAEDIHSSVNISGINDISQEYIQQDDPKDPSLTCSLVPGDMEGVSDDCNSVNTSRRNDLSQEELYQNDPEDPGCFRSNHSRSSAEPLVQHKECSQLLGGGTGSKSSHKKSKSSRCHQDNSENSDSDGSRSRTSSRNLVDSCGTDGHQEDQDLDVLQDFSGGNTGKDCERSRSVSPQSIGQCSRTVPLNKAFSNWKLSRSASSGAKIGLGEQTDENFSKYNDCRREMQNTLTNTSPSELSSPTKLESFSGQGSKVRSSPSEHKKSYVEDCVNSTFPSERALSCSVSPKSANSYNGFEVEGGECEGVSEDHVRTERISSKTDGSGSNLSLNQHTRNEIHSPLRLEGNSDGISLKVDYISDGSSHRSASLDCSVDSKLQSQVSMCEEKQTVMNSEDHQNERVSQKINCYVSEPLNSDLGSTSCVPSTKPENFYKNKMSAKRDQSKSKLNSKPHSESHIRSHERSLKLSNGFDLALDESSKYSHCGKTSSRERKNKKPLLGDNRRTDSEPVEKEKSTSSRPHSKSSSERKSDVRKNRTSSKNKKLSSVRKSADHSLRSKDGEEFEAYESKSLVPNEFDKGVLESYKVSDHVEHSKVVDSSHSGSTKVEDKVIRNLGSEKRCNVTKAIGSSEVGRKDGRNKCKRTRKNEAEINTRKQSVSCNEEDTVMDKSVEQAAEDDNDVNTTTAGESRLDNSSSSGQNTDTNKEIGGEDSLKQLLLSLGIKYGKEKLLSIVSSLGDSSSAQGKTENKEATPCPEEREQLNEGAQKCSPKELGRTHVRNLNNAFEETDIRPGSVVIPGTKDSDQKGESSEVITDNKQQPTNGEIKGTSSCEQRHLISSESYSNVKNFIRNQEIKSQINTLSDSIKPLKGVGNCYKEMDDNRKMNSSAASVLKIRSKPISCEPVVNNSVDSSSKQPRANVKRNSCIANVASSSQPPGIVDGEREGDSGSSEELSATNPKLQGSPNMRARSQKTPPPRQGNAGHENVLSALHPVKPPRSRDDRDKTVSGLLVKETPARSSSENSCLSGNDVHLSERKEIKKVPEANKVVHKTTSPILVMETPARSSSENSCLSGNDVHLSERKEIKKVPEANKVVHKTTSPILVMETPARSSSENSCLSGNDVHLSERKEIKKVPEANKVVHKTTSPILVMETPARSSSENSCLSGNDVHLSERKEIKKVPEANKVVQKTTSPVRKRLKRNWIVKPTENPPVPKTTLVMASSSTPPASTTPVPSPCSSLVSSPSHGDVLSPNVTTGVEVNASQKSVPSYTLNLPSSEGIKKVPSVLERKGVCEESPFKIPSPDTSQKNVPVSSKTQEVSLSRTSPNKPQPRVLNIPKINTRPSSSSSTANPMIKPMHPRITAPSQTNEEDCDDDDAISLFAESTDLDLEDMNSTLSSMFKRQTTSLSNFNSPCTSRLNFVPRQAIQVPPVEPEPVSMQTELLQEMEDEENNQEEKEERVGGDEEEEMEVDRTKVDDCEALDGIEDDRESVLAELQSLHSTRSIMDYLVCNNSEEVKLCVRADNLKPFSPPRQDSRVFAETPAQTTVLSPGRAALTNRVSAVTCGQSSRLPVVAPAPTTRASPAMALQTNKVSPESTRPSLQTNKVSPESTRPSLQTNRQSFPVTSAQAIRPSPVQAPAAQDTTFDISPEFMDFHVPKILKYPERNRFSRMVLRHCFSYLKYEACYNPKCNYKHQVPIIQKNDDVLKVMKWSSEQGYKHMASVYTQKFIQYVCDTARMQGVLLWNGILGCLIHAGKSVDDAISSVITYVFYNDRTEYFAPVLELLVKHNKLLFYRNILLKVDTFQGFEYPLSVIRYLLTEPKTQEDLLDITVKFIKSESLNRCLCRVERSLINRYLSVLRSAGLMEYANQFDQVSRMPVLDYNQPRTFVNGREGLLPTPDNFRQCTTELFKVPLMSVKQSMTQAKCNLRNNYLSRKFSSDKQQLMESSNVKTVCETSRPMNSKNFGSVITSEFDASSSHNFITEPEAVEHELPHNGLVTRLVPPRTLLEDQSCNFSSYPRNMSPMAKGQEVHNYSAGNSSSKKVMLLNRAGNDNPFRVPTLGNSVEQEPQLCSSPFSGSGSSQPHFSLSSLSQEGRCSPFSRKKSPASESNSSKSATDQLSPVERRQMEDFEPSRVDLQERLPVKSRLGAPHSSPLLEESQWDPASVWEVPPTVVERDARTRLHGRSRDSDISRLPEWKLLNVEQERDFHNLAAPVRPCSPAAVDESLITLRRVLLSGDMSSALNILRNFCAHDMQCRFAREAYLALKTNVQMSSILFGRLMLQSDREQKPEPLLHMLCTIGVNLMFDLMDKRVMDEAHVIYTFLREREIHPAMAKIFQEQMSPCSITLKCCEICMSVKNYHEAMDLLLANELQYAKPERWKIPGVPNDSRYRIEIVRNLLQVLTNDGPSVTACQFLTAIIQAQCRKSTAPIDIRRYTNTVMLNLLQDGRRSEAINLYMEIESEVNCLEGPTYRWLLITVEQENRTAIAHRLYGVACRVYVYPLVNFNSRPLHIKVFSYWLHEEILVVIRDFLHQLKQGQLKPTDDPAHLNLCIYIETQMKPQQSQQKPYPQILTQVKDSIDDVKQRLFSVLRRLRLQATSVPKDRMVQIKPESLAEWLKSPAF